MDEMARFALGATDLNGNAVQRLLVPRWVRLGTDPNQQVGLKVAIPQAHRDHVRIRSIAHVPSCELRARHRPWRLASERLDGHLHSGYPVRTSMTAEVPPSTGP